MVSIKIKAKGPNVSVTSKIKSHNACMLPLQYSDICGPLLAPQQKQLPQHKKRRKKCAKPG